MKYLGLTAIAALTVALSGCSTTFGVPFDGAALRQLTPGVSTKSDLVAKVGPQVRPEVVTMKKDLAGTDLPNPLIVEHTSYYFTDKAAPSISPDVNPSRIGFVDIVDSSVVFSNYSSSFAADSTDFDESKVSQVVKGKSTEQDVIAIFGQPSGRAIYPYAKEPGGSRISYLNISYNKTTNKIRSKAYVVYLDKQRVVSDFDLKITEK